MTHDEFLSAFHRQKVSFVLDKQACEEYNLNVLQDTKQNETVLTIVDQS